MCMVLGLLGSMPGVGNSSDEQKKAAICMVFAPSVEECFSRGRAAYGFDTYLYRSGNMLSPLGLFLGSLGVLGVCGSTRLQYLNIPPPWPLPSPPILEHTPSVAAAIAINGDGDRHSHRHSLLPSVWVFLCSARGRGTGNAAMLCYAMLMFVRCKRGGGCWPKALDN